MVRLNVVVLTTERETESGRMAGHKVIGRWRTTMPVVNIEDANRLVESVKQASGMVGNNREVDRHAFIEATLYTPVSGAIKVALEDVGFIIHELERMGSDLQDERPARMAVVTDDDDD